MKCALCEELAVVLARPKDEEWFSVGLCMVHARERFRPHRFCINEFDVADVVRDLKDAAALRGKSSTELLREVRGRR